MLEKDILKLGKTVEKLLCFGSKAFLFTYDGPEVYGGHYYDQRVWLKDKNELNKHVCLEKEALDFFRNK